MNKRKENKPISSRTHSLGPYTVYSAGGLFTQEELSTNILIKEYVWRLSNGKFKLILPQSKELQMLGISNVEAYIRNDDLLQVMQADLILARLDGLELDSGTVVEFSVAKFLGKPVVILRTDFRRQSCTGLSEPYNLMVKNWPRTVEIHLDSYMLWARLLAEEHETQDSRETFRDIMGSELSVMQKSMEEIAAQIITGMETVIELESPYPQEFREVVYHAVRFSLGSGFDEYVPESKIDEIIQRLKDNGTL